MADNLNAVIRSLMVEHDLTSLSIGMSLKLETHHWTAYAHWDGYSSTGHNCVTDNGDTAEQAIAATLRLVQAARDSSVGVPDLSIEMAA